MRAIKAVTAERAPRLYLYSRVSSKRQEKGTGIDRQLAQAEAWAKPWAQENGYVIDRELKMVDVASSGFHGSNIKFDKVTGKGGALGRFLALFDAGGVRPGDALQVESLDRFSRQESIFAREHFDKLVRGGVRVITSIDNKEYSLAALKQDKTLLLWAEIVMTRAHEESERKSVNARGAIKTKCQRWVDGKRGFLVGSPRMFSEEKGRIVRGTDPVWTLYNPKENRMELSEPGVSAARLAVALYMEGHGALVIARRLEKEGLVIGNGNDWGVFQVQRLLESRSLIGEKVFKVEGVEYVLEGYYPPVITQHEWDALRLTAKNREVPRANAGVPPILTASGIAFCATCGNALIGSNQYRNRSRKGQVFVRRLRCSHAIKKDGVCTAGVDSCLAKPVERAVLEFCGEQSNLERLFRVDNSASPVAAKLDAKRNEAVRLQAKLAKYEQRLEDEDDPLTKTERSALRKTETDLEATTAEIIELEQEARVNTHHKVSTAKEWKALKQGVLDFESDARMKARKLMVDTFARIEVNLMPYAEPDKTAPLHIRLQSRRGDAVIMLAVNRRTGEIVGEVSKVPSSERLAAAKHTARTPRKK